MKPSPTAEERFRRLRTNLSNQPLNPEENLMGAPRVRRGPLTDVRLERMRRGLRLVDVAEKIGVSIATWSLVERGLRPPTADELARLRRLGLPSKRGPARRSTILTTRRSHS